ncbi:MAG: hypothetical protein RLZZ557_2263 [Bacteroidota bacterium]
MISIFRNNTPLAIGLLILLAIMPELNPIAARLDQDPVQNTIVYGLIQQLGNWLGFDSGISGKVIRIAVSLVSALLINRMVTDHKLMEKPGFLPALCFLLLQLLIPTAINFHILFINILLLATLKIMILVYKMDRPMNSLLGAGFLLGTVALTESTAILFFAWLTAALLIMRPASLREWLMALTGYGLPIYFLAAVLYLIDALDMSSIYNTPDLDFTIPTYSVAIWTRISIVLFVPILCFFMASQQISKLLIQGRKTFIICFVMSIVLMALILSDLPILIQSIHLTLVPATLLMAPVLVNARKAIFPNLFILAMLVLSQLR